MLKPIFFRILLVANIVITVLIIAFIFIARLNGMKLALSILMAVTGLFGAAAMYQELQRRKSK
jgi:hypothetical protein